MSDAKLLKKKITENLIFMKENISDIEKITDSLIEKGVIDILDRPKFLGDHKTQKDKIHGVLEEVKTKRNSSSATNAELFKEKGFTQQAYKSFVLNVEKKELQQEISQLQIEQKRLLSQLVLKLNIKTLDSENKRLQTSNANIAKEKELLSIRVQQLEIKVHLLTQELGRKTEGINKIEKQNIELLHAIKLLKDQSIEDRAMHRKQREEDKNMFQKHREEDKNMFQKQREEDKNMYQQQRKEGREFFAQHMTDFKADMKKEMQTILNTTLDQRENKNKTDEERLFVCKMDDMKTELEGTFKVYLDKQRDQNKTFIDEVQAKLKAAKKIESNFLDNQRKEEKSRHNQTRDKDGRRLNPHMDEMKAHPDDATETIFCKSKPLNTNDVRNKSVTKNKINYNRTADLRKQIPKQ
ncbi:unnamed protein product [Mytilus coruscus]|uniref:CARD domain-containing protein n=1 Tax=Mytilus coruscus TaxID=42192 RepID=A0A6J8C0T9_MYTCO|nr:unnamed protein product [Mytilus coruscus]